MHFYRPTNAIKMPDAFQKLLFNVKEEGDDSIREVFESHPNQESVFKSNIETTACELGIDYEGGAKWVLAREHDEDYWAFFMFPNNDKQQYTIKLPSLDPNDDAWDEMDAFEEEVLEATVDEKTFGLITLLSVFDEGMYCRADDEAGDELSWLYMDIGENLNQCILSVFESLDASNDLTDVEYAELKEFRRFVSNYLRPEPDDHWGFL